MKGQNYTKYINVPKRSITAVKKGKIGIRLIYVCHISNPQLEAYSYYLVTLPVRLFLLCNIYEVMFPDRSIHLLYHSLTTVFSAVKKCLKMNVDYL